VLGCFGAHGAPYGRFAQAIATLFAPEWRFKKSTFSEAELLTGKMPAFLLRLASSNGLCNTTDV
jgi:hypothetical protein